MTETLYELKKVSKGFPLGLRRRSQALFEISLELRRGETLGILGESGCGKSTLARVMMGVYRPDEGELLFHGEQLSLRTQRQRKAFGGRVQMVFQDPYQSLDPQMTVRDILAENLELHDNMTGRAHRRRIEELLEQTGLSTAYAERYPSELSGGQRQRISIARAIAARPELIICDEPVSALDQSVRWQVMELLKRLKRELGLTYLFIAHDVELVGNFADRVAVMYAGRIMELGDAELICTAPFHPYSELLLNSVLPKVPGKKFLEQAQILEEASRKHTSSGCPFASRCARAQQRCYSTCPPLTQREEGHFVACHII